MTTIQLPIHPEFGKKKLEWDDYLVFFSGDEKKLKTPAYLWMHQTEDASRQEDERDKQAARLDRALREQRTKYVNYAKFIINRFTTLLLKGGFSYSELNNLLSQEELEDIDGSGKSFNSFFAEVTEDLILYGSCFVLTDTFTKSITNRQEEIESGARPYLLKLSPLSVVDWERSRKEIELLRFEYEFTPSRKLITEAHTKEKRCKVLKLEGGKYVIDEYKGMLNDNPINLYVTPNLDSKLIRWALINTVFVDLNYIPISSIVDKESWLKDGLPLIQKIFNKQSDFDNILYNQGYDKLFIFADLEGSVGVDGKPMSDSQRELFISTNTITIIRDPQGKVQKIEPTNPEALIKAIKDDFADLLKVCFHITRLIQTSSNVAESAETRKEAKEDLFTKLSQKREEILDIVNQSMADYLAFKGLKKESRVTFSQELTEGDLTQFVMDVKIIADRIDKYPEWRKSVDKKIVEKMKMQNASDLFLAIDASQDTGALLVEQKKGAFNELINSGRR